MNGPDNTSTGKEELGADGAPDLGLGGALPCAVCKYNLQGISILGVCPECGTAVRATILAVVDPLAEELRPLPAARLAAVGLLVWSLTAFGAALAGWRIAADRFAPVLGHTPVTPGEFWVWLGIGLLAVSGAAACAFVLAVRVDGKGAASAGLLGAFMYLPATVAVWKAHVAAARAPVVDDPFVAFWEPDPARPLWRLAVYVCLAAALALLRPSARLLVARSLVIRTGRVDRQTIAAMAAALGLVAAGDLLGLAATRAQQEVAQQAGAVLMAAGALLLTLGLAGAVADCWRMARALVAPSPGVGQVLHGRPPGEGRA